MEATLVVVMRAVQYDDISCCGAWALGHAEFSSCSSRALERRLSSCAAQASLLHGVRDLPGPGIEPLSLALAHGFSTTGSPGEPHMRSLKEALFLVFKNLFILVGG